MAGNAMWLAKAAHEQEDADGFCRAAVFRHGARVIPGVDGPNQRPGDPVFELTLSEYNSDSEHERVRFTTTKDAH